MTEKLVSLFIDRINRIYDVGQIVEQNFRPPCVVKLWQPVIATRLSFSRARELLALHGRDPAEATDWDREDFDSIYVVTIVRSEDVEKAAFAHMQEELDGQPEAFPRCASRKSVS
jgi:hypothetical protein